MKERTARAFLAPPGKTQNYYRTGDRVRRPLPGKPIVYLGRVDNQIKILGHRVELGEIEAVVPKISGVDGVVALVGLSHRVVQMASKSSSRQTVLT